MNRIRIFGNHNFYWIGLIILGLSMEAVALYYQYVLDEWPCVLCIHIRIWIAGFILLAMLALIIKRSSKVLVGLHLLNTLMMAGFVERSWQTLGVERGWIFGDCDMNSGLPDWFALDRWFPALFEVQTSCGYTPLIALNISMAEILMTASSLLLIFSLLLLLSSCWSPAKQDY